MKTLLKFVFVIALIVCCNNIFAQKPLKLAYVDMQALVASMPAYDSAMVKMQKVQKELQDEMELLNVERNKKYEDYTTNSKNWTDLVRQSREQEIMTMNQKIQTFQESAMESLQQEEAKLMQPLLDRANKAIDAVAKANDITYVLNSQAILAKSMDSLDLLPLVQQHMGIKK